MPLDTLICGLCEETFTDLNDFVLHKQTGCGATQPQQVVVVKEEGQGEEHHQPGATTGGQPLSSQSMSVPGTQQHQHEPVVSTMITKLSSQNEGDCDSTRADAGDLAFLDDAPNIMEAELGLVDRPSDGSSNADSSSHTYVILKDADLDPAHDGASQNVEVKMESAFSQLEGSELEVLSASQLMASSAVNDPGTTTVVISQEEFEAILNKQQGQLTVTKEIPAKKPRVGRAKKGEGKNQILEAVPPSTPRPSAPETNADGKLVCPQCKRTFTKERHFNTHKCLASSSYVDISKRDVVKIDSGDEEEEISLYLDLDDGGHEDEDDREFSAPMEESLQVEREEEEDEHEMDKDENVEEYRPRDEVDDDDVGGVVGVKGMDEDGGPAPKRRKVTRRRGRPSRVKANPDDKPLEGTGGKHVKQAVEAMENLPIFKNEEDKVAFEACIDVDLSQVDHMFRVHVIEQELNNSSGSAYNTPTVSSLSVYSCTVCEKVFKSLSHIRLHCITHTDLKPFKCNKCDYTTNSKGNLYTHMRKHTGQYYRCDQCDFKTVNKSHLVEHQMTHDSRRPTCLLCNKDYSTVKSMINHIRKYHTNKAGREYLATFLSGRGQKGNAIIHQCHICNRKFKKRIDRDRHLFIHDIKDLPNVQMCELCDYWASRKVYLDKHYSKHRVIYCCTICQNKFLSVARLASHLSSEHCSPSDNGLLMSDSLLQECINKSFYLPEPVATTVEGSKYVNLPTVLTDSGQGQQQQEEDQNPNQSQVKTENTATSSHNDDTVATNNENTNNNSFNSEGAMRDDTKLLGTNEESNGTSNYKIDSSSDMVSMSTNDIAVSSASSTADTPAFPFSNEYRDLIHAEDGVSNLKSEEEMMMMMPLPGGTLTDSENNPVEVTCLESGNLVNTSGENGKLNSIMSNSSSNVVGDKESLNEGGDQSLTEELSSGAKDIPTSTVLMLQNPGSDTEDKEDEEGEGDDVPQQQDEEEVEGGVAGGMEALEEEDGDEEGNDSQQQQQQQGVAGGLEGMEDVGEAPRLAEDNGIGKDVNGEPDNANQEANTAEEGNKQKDAGGDEGVKTDGVGGGTKEDKIQSIIDKMGYRKMTFDIFNKMRETFGTEECEYCGRLFYNKMDHETHLRTHTGDKPFACAHCSFRSTTRDGLRRHSEKEHEKIAYQCKECDFLAPTRTRLWNHQLKHLGITGLSCSQCPEKFDSMKQLRAHMLNCHQDMDKEDMEKLTGYIRRPQGKMGRRSFKCPHCPRVFIRANSELQKHIWIHEGIKPFACPLCKYACRSKNNLQAHMLRHSAEKPFSCSECGKEYKSKTALRWHVRSHKSGKLFKCDKCPYEATQSSHLKRHMEIHDVMKRFVCKHCKFSANTLGYMKIHYAKHHKGQPFIQEESVPPKDGVPNKGVYKCLSCGYLFGNLSDLKRHLKVRHHIQMQDIAGMDQMQISEVEVVQFDDTAVVMGNQPLPDIQQVQHVQQVLQPAQVAAPEFQLQPQDANGAAMPAATANLIQQIFGINQGENQQVRVVSEDGQPLDISPDTIILQQDGQLLMTNEMPGNMLPGNQYIIQYFNPGEVPQESTVMGDNSSTPSIHQPVVSVAAPDQIQLVQTVGGAQQQQEQQPTTTQFIITSGGEIGPAQLATQVIATTSTGDASGEQQQLEQQQQHHPTSSDLNNTVSQFVMTAAPTDVGTQQLISIDGQTHQIITAAANPTATSSTTTSQEVSLTDTDIVVANSENQIISSISQHHQKHQLDNSNQELLSVVGEGAQFITSDVDAYSTQLIISDREVGDNVTEGVDLVSSDDPQVTSLQEGQ